MRSKVLNDLHPLVREALKEIGIDQLTEIQEKAIPLILKGFNTLVVAPTGSGKTEAAIIPILSLILQQNLKGKLRVIYITPLRALNRDINVRVRRLASLVGLKTDVWHGDTPQYQRKRISKEIPEILITTPESFQNILVNNSMKEKLKDVKWVIVDELHELLESKRGAELSVGLERLSRVANFVRVGLSATIANVDEAKRFLGGGFVVESISDLKKEVKINVIIEDGYDNMLNKLKEIVKNTEKGIIVFTNTRDLAEIIGKELKEYGFYVHHGSLSREERESVEQMLRMGEIKGVVATSSLELGIDIGHVDLVIQFSSPRQAVNLVQRVGRSRHKPDEVPEGILIVGLRPYEAFEGVVLAKRASNGELERPSIHKDPLDVLAHQIVGILLQFGRLTPLEVYDIIKSAYPFENLNYSDFVDVLTLLKANKLITCREGLCEATKKGAIYYRRTTMIVESKRLKVKVYGGGVIGSLDEEFVMENCYPGATFVLGGKVWRVLSVEDEYVIVEESESEAQPPSWEGDLIPVEYQVAREVGALKRTMESGRPHIKVPPKLFKYLKEQTNSNVPLATDKRIVIESDGRTAVINIHGGSKVNLALAHVLSQYLKLLGFNIAFVTTPYHVVLTSTSYLSSHTVKSALLKIKDLDIETLLLKSIKESKLFKWKLIKILVRFGLLNRERISYKELSKLEKGLVRVYKDLPPGREAIKEILTEKVDLIGLKNFLSNLNKLEIVAVDIKQFSPQSQWALDIPYRQEVKRESKSLILEAVKRRIEEKEVTLVCLRCGKMWSGKVKDVPLRCSCGSKFVAPVFKGESIRKGTEIRERGNLLLSYGRDALYALAGRGLGAKRASQVLREVKERGLNLIEAIVEAEKQFLRTRDYWKQRR